MVQILAILDRSLGAAMRWLCIGCISILFVVLSAVVLVRFIPVAKLSWSDEVVEWAFAWMVFMGAAALWRECEHFCVDALTSKLERRPSGFVLCLFIETLSAIFAITLTYYGYILTVNANDRSPILEWPRPIWYLCIPLAGCIMTCYALRNLIRLILTFFRGDSCIPPIPPVNPENRGIQKSI